MDTLSRNVPGTLPPKNTLSSPAAPANDNTSLSEKSHPSQSKPYAAAPLMPISTMASDMSDGTSISFREMYDHQRSGRATLSRLPEKTPLPKLSATPEGVESTPDQNMGAGAAQTAANDFIEPRDQSQIQAVPGGDSNDAAPPSSAAKAGGAVTGGAANDGDGYGDGLVAGDVQGDSTLGIDMATDPVDAPGDAVAGADAVPTASGPASGSVAGGSALPERVHSNFVPQMSFNAPETSFAAVAFPNTPGSQQQVHPREPMIEEKKHSDGLMVVPSPEPMNRARRGTSFHDIWPAPLFTEDSDNEEPTDSLAADIYGEVAQTNVSPIIEGAAEDAHDV